MYSNFSNEFYTIKIYDIIEEKAHDIIHAFADRDIEIEISEDIDGLQDGIYTMTISKIREITMTPFMIWFLHHVDNGDYYKLVIS